MADERPLENAARLPEGRWEGFKRYPRAFLFFLRYCLVRELAFRVNFLARVVAGVAWLFLLVFYFQLIFLKTERIGEWDRHEFLFFVGTGFLINAIVDAFFLENCTRFSELIRTGDLDFALTKPIDEQFYLTCQRIDWAEVPSIFVGIGLLAYAGVHVETPPTWDRIAGYAVLVCASVAVLYSLMVIMAASSVWIVRNKGLYEMWFYVTQFGRYPADIYKGGWLGVSMRVVFTFILPVLLAITVPARFGIKIVSGPLVAYLLLVALLLLFLSRRFFRFALRAYRSASS